MAKKLKAYPTTRLGWSNHYAEVFNKTGTEESCHLALWYYLLHLAFDADTETT